MKVLNQNELFAVKDGEEYEVWRHGQCKPMATIKWESGKWWRSAMRDLTGNEYDLCDAFQQSLAPLEVFVWASRDAHSTQEYLWGDRPSDCQGVYSFKHDSDDAELSPVKLGLPSGECRKYKLVPVEDK